MSEEKEELQVRAAGEIKFKLSEGEAVLYLEHRKDGTVWCLWPDGKFIEVVPKEKKHAG